MSDFIKVLENASLHQVSWDVFQNTDRDCYYIDQNQTVWVKWDHLITKYHFNVENILQKIEVEYPVATFYEEVKA